MREPELALLIPEALAQRVGIHNQHLARVVQLVTVADAVLRAKQTQPGIRLPRLSDKRLQQGNASDYSIMLVVPAIARYIVFR